MGFTKLLVTDLQASAAFYETVFGLEQNYRVQSDISGRAIEEILFKAEPGAATFVLLRFDGTEKASSDEVILGFITEDIEGVFTRATAAGGAVATPFAPRPEHGVTVGFLKDNEGHLIEVVQRLTGAA